MTDEDKIEIEAPYEAADVEAVIADVEPEVVRKGVRLPTVLTASLIAALLGAAGGSAVAWTLRTTPADMSSVEAQITTLRSERDVLKTRIAKLEARKIPAAVSAAPRVDLTPLERRLEALESAPPPVMPELTLPDIDPETLTALRSAQDAGFEYPDISGLKDALLVLGDRIDALESRPAEVIYQAPEALPEPELDPASELERVDMEDTFTADVAAPINVPAIAFPKVALLTAAEELRIESSGGFFSRTIAKNVRVKDGKDNLSRIERISDYIETDRLGLAVEEFEALPSQLRSVGDAWYDSVKDAPK